MKHLNLIIIFICLALNAIQAQDIFSSTPINDVQTVTEGTYPETNTISLGGQEKTASGVFRVLVIFVRYLDDTENTATWSSRCSLKTCNLNSAVNFLFSFCIVTPVSFLYIIYSFKCNFPT